jgi:hypothetical protein
MKKKIENEFIGKGEVKGFAFSKAFEKENGYVFKVESNNSIWYEAFLKKEVPICIDFEKRIYSDTETKEVYPKATDFGNWAWSVKKLEYGINKIKQ